MLYFIVTYFLLLVTGSAFILGWYFVTRSGQLLGFWEHYWEGIVDHKRIYYEDEGLEERLMFILKTQKSMRGKLELAPEGKSILVKNQLTDDEIFAINDTAGLMEVKDNEIIFLYENDPVFKFPTWVRKVTSGCPPCMSSLYGSVFWWTVVLLQNDMFSWTNSAAAPVVFWLFYCTTLVFMNYFIHRIAKLK